MRLRVESEITNKNERENMLKVRQVAEICHETNRVYCQSLGDSSQLEWTDAPEWQRTSAINGVIFHRNNPEASPSASHENWLEEKRAAGWTYGVVKNPEKKEHPCFVPFTGLPVEQQAKDRLFKGIVDSLRDLIEPAAPFTEPKAQ